MEGILNFAAPLDVGLLDRVVNAMFTGGGAEQQQAQRVLTQFQEHLDAWQRVPEILEQSQNPQTKYIALQIMEKLINARWKTLSQDDRQGVRNFIVQVIVTVAADEASIRAQKAYLGKLNLVLVQILKQEWPHNWPDFIPEIVSSSKSNLVLCENNLVILKLLSEEVFDYSAEQMTQAKTKALKNQMCQEFAAIFTLCHEILKNSTKPSLLKTTLETLLRFLNWIPLGYIFETDIIDQLVSKFLEMPDLRNISLKCLAEIGGLQIGPDYNERFVILFNMVMTSVNKWIPPNTNIASVYANSSDQDQELVLNLALFLTSYLGVHLRLIENAQNSEVLLNAHLYLVKISQVEEREVFKICLEYWSKLVADLYEEISSLPMTEPLLSLNLGNGFGASAANMLGTLDLRKNLYTDVLSNLRLVIISRMAKPEEVLVVENDEGEVVREFIKEVDTVVLYKQMREVLVYLTHLDVVDTETIMTDKLARQMDGSEWSWHNLNTLCWAIGSISGAMNEESEKRFLVNVIKELLSLTEMKRGKDNKAVVASDIMYIVGQYPRFLKAHWKFLKTVVNKLFEFMHETHEGVQDMACDTFIKIAQKCRRHFVMQQSGETEPFVDEILRNLGRITNDLQQQQMHTVFEAIGYMIAAQPNKAVQERLIVKLMEMPNVAWEGLLAQARQDPNLLSSPEAIKQLSHVLKTNVSACVSIGSFFLPQLLRVYEDMLSLYKAVSGMISEAVAAQGLVATKTPKVRGLRTIKKEILKFVETYVKKAEDLEMVKQNLIPSLLEAVLGDYNRNVPAARDAEVLNVMTTIVTRLGPLITDRVGDILGAVFECTLSMINQDMAEFPEHRVAFFKMLRAINLQCFPALVNLAPDQFKLVIDAILFAFKHTHRDIADTGLSICLELINNVAMSEPAIANGFFSSYFVTILAEILYVLTDADHKSGFKNQSLVLQRMFYLVETGQISAPLSDQVTGGVTNAQFLRNYCCELLKSAFSHVGTAQIQTFVNGLLEHNQDQTRFKQNLRDFLVQLREVSGDSDNAELFLEEKEAEAKIKQEAEQARAAAVPGMLKPSEMKQEEEEL